MFTKATLNYRMWYQRVLEATSHGMVYAETVMVDLFLSGADAYRVAYDCDFDYEEGYI